MKIEEVEREIVKAATVKNIALGFFASSVVVEQTKEQKAYATLLFELLDDFGFEIVKKDAAKNDSVSSHEKDICSISDLEKVVVDVASKKMKDKNSKGYKEIIQCVEMASPEAKLYAAMIFNFIRVHEAEIMSMIGGVR